MKLHTLKQPAAWSTLLAYILVFASPYAQAAPGTLSNIPLFLTTSVQPNVMLLIDNSGSMNNITWDAGYDNTVVYPDWGRGDGTTRDWTPTDANKTHASIDRGPCAANQKRGNNGVTTKCLVLPDSATRNVPVLAAGNTLYSGNYLNYLFQTYANNADLTTNNHPVNLETRITVAKTVANNVINNTPNMRFGVARFNNNQGATIAAPCGSTVPVLTGVVAGLAANTSTPLAEAFYEITRYFRGMTSQYGSITGNYTSPIQFRCQKNFTIVITDGYPTNDTSFPAANTDPEDNLNATRNLPNWDNATGTPATTTAMFPNFPQDSDGFSPAGNAGNEGFTLFLDDLAQFGNDIDLRRAPALDNTGTSFDDASFPRQRIDTYTIGFALNNQMLQDAATKGKGLYYTATDIASLTTALTRVMSSISSKAGSAAAVAFNTATLGTSSAVYQAKFDPSLWSGELLSYALNSITGNLATSPTWNAKTQLDARNISTTPRTILTYNADTGVKKGIPFQWNTTALSTTQQADLNMGPGGADGYGSQRVAFLRGDRSLEGAAATTTNPSLRVRGSRLGDIVHSNPVFVGKPDLNYEDTLPYVGTPYSTFKTAQAGRRGVVYVGANDGMLHGFDSANGAEVMAYIPHNLFSNAAGKGLHYLTDQAYDHLFYVDQGPTVSDVYIKTTASGTAAWKTVLVGGEEAGGRGLFALDITDPNTFSEGSTAADNTVMWEFTDADDSNLGYTFSKPTVALMNNGKWAVIVGNGYNDTATLADGGGEAKLFILYLEGGLDGIWTPGTDYFEITTKAGSTTDRNGLGTPATVDLDGNGTVDRVYAGDLQGNMWAFDLSDTSVSNPTWKVAYAQSSIPKPLFTAKIGTTAQPITTKPSVIRHPTIPKSSSNEPNLMVLFGTGQYLVAGDTTTTATQSFYSVWDKGTFPSTTSPVLRSDLVAQTFLTGLASNARVLSDNAVDYGSKYGWSIDLAAGERVVVNPKVRGDYVFFNTMTPNNAACSFGGSSWLMAAKLVNGGRPSDSVFDYNNNNSVDTGDKLAATVTTTVVTTASTITTTTTIGGVTTTTVTSNTSGTTPCGATSCTVTTTTSTGIAVSGRRMQQDAIAAESAFLGDHQYTANSGDQNGASVDEGRINTGTPPTQGRLSWKEIRR